MIFFSHLPVATNYSPSKPFYREISTRNFPITSHAYFVTGRHSQGLSLPGCVYEHTMLFCWSIHGLKYILAMLFCWNISYTGDALLLEYVIMGDAVLLEYIRAMLGVATPNPLFTKAKFLSTQFFGKMFWSPRFLYILTISLEKVPVHHDLLYNTAILTYKYTFLIFISRYAVPARTITKKPWRWL